MSWFTLKVIIAFLHSSKSALANTTDAWESLSCLTISISFTMLSKTLFGIFANALIYQANLIGALTIRILSAARASIFTIVTDIRFAHVVVIVAFFSNLELFLACVFHNVLIKNIQYSTELRCWITVIRSSLNSVCGWIDILITDTLVTIIVFVPVSRAESALALFSFIAVLVD